MVKMGASELLFVLYFIYSTVALPNVTVNELNVDQKVNLGMQRKRDSAGSLKVNKNYPSLSRSFVNLNFKSNENPAENSHSPSEDAKMTPQNIINLRTDEMMQSDYSYHHQPLNEINFMTPSINEEFVTIKEEPVYDSFLDATSSNENTFEFPVKSEITDGTGTPMDYPETNLPNTVVKSETFETVWFPEPNVSDLRSPKAEMAEKVDQVEPNIVNMLHPLPNNPAAELRLNSQPSYQNYAALTAPLPDIIADNQNAAIDNMIVTGHGEAFRFSPLTENLQTGFRYNSAIIEQIIANRKRNLQSGGRAYENVETSLIPEEKFKKEQTANFTRTPQIEVILNNNNTVNMPLTENNFLTDNLLCGSNSGSVQLLHHSYPPYFPVQPLIPNSNIYRLDPNYFLPTYFPPEIFLSCSGPVTINCAENAAHEISGHNIPHLLNPNMQASFINKKQGVPEANLHAPSTSGQQGVPRMNLHETSISGHQSMPEVKLHILSSGQQGMPMLSSDDSSTSSEQTKPAERKRSKARHNSACFRRQEEIPIFLREYYSNFSVFWDEVNRMADNETGVKYFSKKRKFTTRQLAEVIHNTLFGKVPIEKFCREMKVSQATQWRWVGRGLNGAMKRLAQEIARIRTDTDNTTFSDADDNSDF